MDLFPTHQNNVFGQTTNFSAPNIFETFQSNHNAFQNEQKNTNNNDIQHNNVSQPLESKTRNIFTHPKLKLTKRLKNLHISKVKNNLLTLQRTISDNPNTTIREKPLKIKTKSKRYNCKTAHNHDIWMKSIHFYLCKVLPVIPKRYQKLYVFQVYGKRNCDKRVSNLSSIDPRYKFVYNQIAFQLKQHPEKIQHIKSYETSNAENKISGRTIYDFIIKYCQSKNIYYYVNKSNYPYQIVGNRIYSMHNEIDHDVEQVMQQHGYERIHLHHSYQRKQQSHRAMTSFAPFKRSHNVFCPIIQDNMSICWWYFFMWFDNVAGMKALQLLITDVRKFLTQNKSKRKKKTKHKNNNNMTRRKNRKRSADDTKINRTQSASKRKKRIVSFSDS